LLISVVLLQSASAILGAMLATFASSAAVVAAGLTVASGTELLNM
jgi:hypothetical protein